MRRSARAWLLMTEVKPSSVARAAYRLVQGGQPMEWLEIFLYGALAPTGLSMRRRMVLGYCPAINALARGLTNGALGQDVAVNDGSKAVAGRQARSPVRHRPFHGHSATSRTYQPYSSAN
jgi:hypothetical protein